MTRTTLTLLISAVVLASAFTGAAAAASNASIDASTTAPGETATHTTTITVGNTSTGSLNGYQVNYQDTGADVSNVGVEDVVAVGIDRDDDADGTTTDVNVSDDLSGVSSSNNGETLSVSFGGSYSLNAGDEIVVVYENVTNPGESGTYDVTLDINYQSSGGEATASLTVGETSTTTTSTTTETTTADTSEDTTTSEDMTTEDGSEETTTSDGGDGESADGESADGESGGDGDSSQSSPGFGVGLTVVALLGAALVALRRAA